MIQRTPYLCTLLILTLAACGDDGGPTPPDARPNSPDAAPPGSPDAAPSSPDAASGAPTVSDQQVTTAEDTAIEITLAAADPDDDALQLTLGLAASGTVTGTLPAVTYTPAPDFAGTDAFSIEVSDGVLTDTAIITVTVTPVNDAPLAFPEVYFVFGALPLEIELEASDVDGDVLTFEIVTQPDLGTLSGEGAVVTYTPDADFDEQDSFTFRVNDGTVDSDVATIGIVVPPTAAAR